jgi:tripartite ATP-independent transporter DctM subunit
MNIFLILLLIIILMAILLASELPIAIALGLAGMVSLYFLLGKGLIGASQFLAWNMSSSFVLIAVPLFTLMGEFIARSVLSGMLYEAIAAWLGRIPGGLLHTNIAVGTIFGAMCGSATAACATIGSVAFPELERRGYDTRMSLGSIGAGASQSYLIPPSSPMIVYGAMTGESIGKLFIAGVIPGLIMAIIFFSYIALVTGFQMRFAPRSEKVSLRNKLALLGRISPVALLIFAVLGGIYLGVATPTEAAAVGAFGAMVMAIAYRSLNFQVLKQCLLNTVKITSMIMFIVVGANFLSYTFNQLGVAPQILKWVGEAGISPLVVLTATYVLYLILGCLIDGVSLIVMTLSITFPVITGLGFDPIWFGVMITILTGIGGLTPPVGLSIYVLQGVTGKSTFEVGRACAPFFTLMIIGMVLFTIFPGLVLWLPSHMM